MKFTVSKYFLFNLYMVIVYHNEEDLSFIFIPDDDSADGDFVSIADCLVEQSKYLCFLESVGTLSIDNEMARRRRAEVKFSHARVLRMCDVVKTSSSLRRRLNLSRFSFW